MSAMPYTVADAPQLTSANAGTGRAVITWTAPLWNGGTPLQGYRVYYGVTTPDIAYGGMVPSGQLNLTINGLDNGTVYRFGVKAVNMAGEGLLSNVLSATPIRSRTHPHWSPPSGVSTAPC